MTGALRALMCAAWFAVPSPATAAECGQLGSTLVDHSCFHARFGPFAAVSAGAPGAPTGDTVDAVHTYYNVAITAADAPAVIAYTAARSGTWAIFTQHAVPVALRDPAGLDLPVRLHRGVPGCPFFAQVGVVDLDAGRVYQLVLGPTPATEVGVVLEKLDDFLALHGRDADGDGFGDPEDVEITPCAPAAGRAPNDGDCNDADPAVHPGADERCGDIDRNCNGVAGDAGASCTIGIGRCAVAATATCDMPGEPPVCQAEPDLPAAEQCNGVDDDCDGVDDADERLCGDAAQPRCIPDGAGGARCGCETDGDCGDRASARLCSLAGAEQRCIDGCVDGFDRNGCPAGERCSSRDPARPGTCLAVEPAGGGCTTVAGDASVAWLAATAWLGVRARRRRRPR